MTECRFGKRRFVMRNVGPDDAGMVLELFKSVFGQPASLAWFEWKYGAGKGEAVGIWDETGRLVAHYAGIPRLLAWQDKPVRGVQIGDVMVTPEMRGLMTRQGPFQQVCSHFFATRVGPTLPYRIAFGFPNQRHFRLGTRLGLYRDGGIIKQLRWPARREDLPLWWSWSELSVQPRNAERQMGAVWKAMRHDLREFVLGMRDAGYLRWRFIARPDRQYRLFVLCRRLTGRALAIVVMRLAGDSAELLDLIGPRRMFHAAATAARDEAARAGAHSLSAWASPAVAEVFRGSGAQELQETPSGALLAVARASEFSADEIAAARWWWMGGDTDFL